MKAMKVLDRIAILLFNLFLTLVCIMTSAICIASTPAFYKKQFEKTGIYATLDENGEEQRTDIYYIGSNSNQTARFSDAQLDVIIHHIVDYLFTDQESFALTMDNVEINDRICNDVDIFGDVAVEHMVEVKSLFKLVIVLNVTMSAFLVGFIVYFIFRWRHVSPLLLKYSLIFYGVAIALAGGFFLWAWIASTRSGLDFATQLWRNFHHILFPFQADKFAGSFFNDTLTQVLTLDFFLGAIATVLIALGLTLTAWFGITVFGKIYAKRNAHPAKNKRKR